jgi:hypothetical protein
MTLESAQLEGTVQELLMHSDAAGQMCIWGTKQTRHVRFNLPTVMTMKIRLTIFWDVMPCSLVEIYRRKVSHTSSKQT